MTASPSSIDRHLHQARALARSEPARAYRSARRALALSESEDIAPDLRATALRVCLQISFEQKHLQETERIEAELLDLMPRCSPAVVGRCKSAIGWIDHGRGHFARALSFTREALAELVQTQETEGELWARNNLASIYRALGSADRAVALYIENRERSRALGSRLLEGGALLNLSLVHNAQADPTAALEAAQQSLPLLDACDDRYAQLMARTQIVEALTRLGRLAEARERIEALRDEPCAIPVARAMVSYYHARTLRHQGEFAAALESARLGLRSLPRATTPEKLFLWSEMALAHEGCGDLANAGRLARKVLRAAPRTKNTEQPVPAHELLARIAERRGRFKEALERHKKLRALEQAKAAGNNEKQRIRFAVELALENAHQDAERARRRNAALEEALMRDSMTGLFNHAAFQKLLTQCLDEGPAAVMMIDVDDFKPYNDSFGHPAGDRLLKELAGVMQRQLRDEDQLARYGGEEFALVMPQHDLERARAVAERLRQAVAAHPAAHRRVTVSIGVAASPPLPAEAAALVQAADRALYRAKHEGKNRVMLASASQQPA